MLPLGVSGHASPWCESAPAALEGTRRCIAIERTARPAGTPGPGQPLRQPITLARLATMQVPVLMIMGDADLLSPPALMRLLAAPIPDCQMVTIPEAEHAAFWEQPELWNRLVLALIAQHQAGAAPGRQ